MIFLPLAVIWFGYQLGWYGYATIQQPVNGGCVGFVDLIMPSKVAKVDACIQSNWGKTGNSLSASPLGPTPGMTPAQRGAINQYTGG